jgi:hypothetical protein
MARFPSVEELRDGHAGRLFLAGIELDIRLVAKLGAIFTAIRRMRACRHRARSSRTEIQAAERSQHAMTSGTMPRP